MAAGSSAPELATSVIAVFVSKVSCIRGFLGMEIVVLTLNFNVRINLRYKLFIPVNLVAALPESGHNLFT